MIASCPKSESVRIFTGVAELCEAQSLTSPPVSDKRTGLVYRNKYCAQCHGVPDKEYVTWRSQWRCSDIIKKAFDEGNATTDFALLLGFCYLLSYDLENVTVIWCTPASYPLELTPPLQSTEH